MATITRQTVRAEIVIGEEFGGIIVRTPDIESFSVHRGRGEPSANFSAAVKINYTDAERLRRFIKAKIRIKAGTGTGFGSLPLIFTGVILRCVFNPIRTDASLVMLNIAGKDDLHVLEGQKINRRLKTYRDGSNPPERWGVVNAIVKHNTPARQRLPLKVWTDRTAVVGLKNNYRVVTPSPFPEINRNGEFTNMGQLSAVKVVEND